MTVLEGLMHALHQSRSFQTELQAQLRQSDPNLTVLSSCCLETISDHHDFTPTTGQLVNNSVQARTSFAMKRNKYCMLSELRLAFAGGVC